MARAPGAPTSGSIELTRIQSPGAAHDTRVRTSIGRKTDSGRTRAMPCRHRSLNPRPASRNRPGAGTKSGVSSRGRAAGYSGRGGLFFLYPRGKDAEVIKNKVSEGTSKNRLNDAEQTLMREAESRGVKIISIGATRPMCKLCQGVADEQGLSGAVATPRK